MTIDADIAALDAADPLSGARAAFDLPAGLTYLDGNSLGPPPRAALARLRQTAEQDWRDGLIRSWNGHAGADGWIGLPARTGAKIARLIGAAAEDVVVADSVSVNLFKLAGALLAEGGRSLAVEADEFPTDAYVLEGLARLAAVPLRRIESGGDPFTEEGTIFVKSLVHYKTAAVADIAATERRAARAGGSVIWDLSHATGLLALDLRRDGARYAVGCGYKYLNGGPGAPAFLYVEGDAAERLSQPISGWMGHAAPFEFAGAYRAGRGAARFLAGTPPILSMAALDAALDVLDGVDLPLVEAKARALADLFLERTASLGLPRLVAEGRRGGHVCLRHPEGLAAMGALIERGVIGDFRTPDLMRFGFSPLFLSFADVAGAAAVVVDVISVSAWRDRAVSPRGAVT